VARLEVQISQLGTQLSQREKGTFPSQPVVNPRDPRAVASTSTSAEVNVIHLLDSEEEEEIFSQFGQPLEYVSSLDLDQLPVKQLDPGCPTISIRLGKNFIYRALVDLGASVNLLPSSVYNKLELGPLKPTRITLQLADKSIKVPLGELEDVLVRVENFTFPADFIVFETNPARQRPSKHSIILGRPFLATASASINCRNGLMTLRSGDKIVNLNVYRDQNRLAILRPDPIETEPEEEEEPLEEEDEPFEDPIEISSSDEEDELGHPYEIEHRPVQAITILDPLTDISWSDPTLLANPSFELHLEAPTTYSVNQPGVNKTNSTHGRTRRKLRVRGTLRKNERASSKLTNRSRKLSLLSSRTRYYHKKRARKKYL
jgi:hypothetical protein